MHGAAGSDTGGDVDTSEGVMDSLLILIWLLVMGAILTGLLYGVYWIGGIWGLVFISVVVLMLVGLRG
jgi:hypothetical protein